MGYIRKPVCCKSAQILHKENVRLKKELEKAEKEIAKLTPPCPIDKYCEDHELNPNDCIIFGKPVKSMDLEKLKKVIAMLFHKINKPFDPYGLVR